MDFQVNSDAILGLPKMADDFQSHLVLTLSLRNYSIFGYIFKVPHVPISSQNSKIIIYTCFALKKKK